MVRHSFFLILSICSWVYCVPELNYNYSDVSLHLRNYKKKSERLSIYLTLVSSYRDKQNFELYENDFSKLITKASVLLENNKKLSFLSMEYFTHENKQALEDMHTILSQDLDSLDIVTEKLEKILSDIHAVIDKVFEGKKSVCESYSKLQELHQKISRCIDLKDYFCVNESLDDVFQERRNYEKCIDNFLIQKKFKTKF